MKTSAECWMAVVEVAGNEGRVVRVTGPAFPAPGGWTYQRVGGHGGTVLSEHSSEAQAMAAVRSWEER